MYRLLVPLLIGSLASGGCYSRTKVPAAEMTRLARGGFGAPIVLQTRTGRRVRLGPRSRVRFLRSDGLWTAWVVARDLRVNAQGIFHRGRGRGRVAETLNGLPFAYVRGVEVRNLSGGKTYLAVLGITVLVAGIVLLIVAMAAGKGGGGHIKVPHLGHAMKGLGRGLGRAATGLGRAMARGSYTLARAWSSGWHWYGPHINIRVDATPPPADYGPPPGAPPGQNGAPPGQNGAPPGQNGAPPGQNGAPPPPPPAQPPGNTTPGAAPPGAYGQAPRQDLQIRRAETTPLFSRRAVRRSKIRLVLATEGGTDLTLRDGGTWAAYAGLRLANVFELGGGVRMLHLGSILPGHADPDTPTTQWIGFGRVAGHFEVDPARRVALPFGFDVGGGEPLIYVRALLGIRVRIIAGLWLSLYPFNPTYTYVKGLSLQRGYDGFTFPTTLELSFAY